MSLPGFLGERALAYLTGLGVRQLLLLVEAQLSLRVSLAIALRDPLTDLSNLLSPAAWALS
jgi:hypothetical protein